MKRINIVLIVITLVIFQELRGQDGEILFKSSCAACHSIGKGKLLGPDLSGITSKRSEEWLQKFIKSTRRMIEANDTASVALVKKYNNFIMPDMALNPTEIKSILSYISMADGNSASVAKPAETQSLSGDADIGKKLFEGRFQFDAKGVACIACHRIDLPDALEGGLFAKNLTHSFTTLGSNDAVTNILMFPPFASMQIAYKENNLTPQEIAHLSSYLKKASEQDQTAGKPFFSMTFLFGFLASIFLFDLISLIWRNRKSRSVNEAIMDRQISKKQNK